MYIDPLPGLLDNVAEETREEEEESVEPGE
jgi:hypothetical protein